RQLLEALRERLQLPQVPVRIEVFDNSHVQGSNAVGAMIVAGPEGFQKNQYRKFNIRSSDLAPGDDFGMFHEVLRRRFRRLLKEAPRAASSLMQGFAEAAAAKAGMDASISAAAADQPWPDLVIIDGGRGQLTAAQEVFAELGIGDVPLL